MNRNKVRATAWAQAFSGANTLGNLLNGAVEIEQFLIETGPGLASEQDAALGAANSLAIRSGSEDELSWSQIVADARSVFQYLTDATSSAQPAPAAIAEPGSEAA